MKRITRQTLCGAECARWIRKTNPKLKISKLPSLRRRRRGVLRPRALHGVAGQVVHEDVLRAPLLARRAVRPRRRLRRHGRGADSIEIKNILPKIISKILTKINFGKDTWITAIKGFLFLILFGQGIGRTLGRIFGWFFGRIFLPIELPPCSSSSCTWRRPTSGRRASRSATTA